jgi:hypothetical protein
MRPFFHNWDYDHTPLCVNSDMRTYTKRQKTKFEYPVLLMLNWRISMTLEKLEIRTASVACINRLLAAVFS